MERVLYPGTFDPITNGHEDLVRRGAKLFTEVVVGVAADTGKSAVFPLEQRVALVKGVLEDLPDFWNPRQRAAFPAPASARLL